MSAKTKTPAPELGAETVPWNPLVAIAYVVFLYFAAQIIGSLLISVYPLLRHWTSQQANDWISNSVPGQFVYVLCAEAITVGAVFLFLKRYKIRLPFIGLKRPRLRDAAAGLLSFPVYFIAYAILVTVVSHFVSGLNVSQQQQIGFDSVHGTWQLLLTALSLVVLPPLAEEILVRGFLYTSLRKYLRFGWAALITSLIFAAAHLPEGGSAGPLYIAALDTFTLSVVLCYLREKTGSLWAGILLHALKNGLAFVSLFIIGGR